MSIRPTLSQALFAAILATTPALAQPAAPPPAPAAAHHDDLVERRVSELHSKLKITPAEEKPFADFAQAMRANAHRMDDAVGAKQAGAQTATAVEQLKAYAEVAETHAQEVNGLVAPFTTLYDALSPAQKKLADQSFRDFSSGPREVRAARG